MITFRSVINVVIADSDGFKSILIDILLILYLRASTVWVHIAVVVLMAVSVLPLVLTRPSGSRSQPPT